MTLMALNAISQGQTTSSSSARSVDALITLIRFRYKDDSMKARVKATNQIVEVEEYSKYLESGWKYRDINTGTLYKAASLDFSTEAVVDYWARLEHQYAGMAMQGIVSSYEAMREISKERDIPQYVANMAFGLARALVDMMKEERK